ncbi:MAG: PilC/PilY family type IV pilus protein [Rhodocyclales bacterium]|nr:PilC/PilY family type IV pilus protein [Rhodocyclales bacterium]
MKKTHYRQFIAWLVMVTMTLTQATQVAALTLATTPLAATTTSTVRPNLMYVLDNSGSMAWDYTPDYVNDTILTGDTATAVVAGGKVTSITASATHTYNPSSPPAVVIEGAGTGASATAVVSASTNKITSITINNQGSGYGATAPYVAIVGPTYGVSGTAYSSNNVTWGMCWGTTGASNQGGTPKDTPVAPQCVSNNGQPPYATSAINYQYYDPAVRYEAPIKANGTRYASSTPSAALNDGFSGAGSTNLTTAWPHEVWCNASTAAPTAADPTAGGKCRENADTSPVANPAWTGVGDTIHPQFNYNLYPNAVYTFRKPYSGSAAYFTMSPAEYCTDTSYTGCLRTTTATVVHNSDGTDTSFNVPSNYRWCSYYNPQTHAFGSCQGRRDYSHYIPNYLGGWVSTGTAGAHATATLAIGPTTAIGQKINSLTIGGVDAVGGTVFTSAAVGDQNTVAASVCAAIQANTGSSGYTCSQTGANVLIQAAINGTAANGLQVIAAGPPSGSPTYATGIITVSPNVGSSVTSGLSIGSITVKHNDGSTSELLGSNITANGSSTYNSIAQAICQAINAGPRQDTYVARSGDLTDVLLNFGTCQNNALASGQVEIKRLLEDQVDNKPGTNPAGTGTITVTGPGAATLYSATITVNATGGATRIDDIAISGLSILTTAPLDYADGNAVNAIASDIVSKISATGCTATASGSVVTLTGTSGQCGATNTVTVTANGAAATGKFRVTPSSNVSYGGDLGAIKVDTTNIVGHLTVSNIANTSDALTDAGVLRTQINNSTATALTVGGVAVGPSGYSAAAPVANGANYDITVTAPALNGDSYNGKSFSFLAGTASGAVSGTSPQWKFDITGAATDSKRFTSIKCGTTDTITQLTATTGAAGATDFIANLSTGAGTNGLNGQGTSSYSYTCNAAGACSLTGPAGAAACVTPTVSADATISIGGWTQTSSGAAGTPQWTFDITGATADSNRINSITCNGTNVINTSGTAPVTTVSTGTTAAAAFIANLSTGAQANFLNARSYTPGGASGPYSYSCTSGGNCTLTGPPGAAACTNLVYANDASISIGASTRTNAGSNESWTFNITDATADSKVITSATYGATVTVTASTASTGSAIATNYYSAALAADIQAQQHSLGGSNDWSSGSGTCSGTGTTVHCDLAMSSSGTPRCKGSTGTDRTMHFTSLPGGVTATGQAETNSGGRYWYAFDLNNVNAANQVVGDVWCQSTNYNPNTAAHNATTGAAPSAAAQKATRINNLTAGLTSNQQNSFVYSCTAATAGSPQSTCTVTVPSTLSGQTYTITPVASSGLTITAPVKTTAVTPQWTLNITGATTASKTINSITCNGTNTFDTASKPSTGTATGLPYVRINNLVSTLGTNMRASYTMSCSPAATSGSAQTSCTISGPAGAAACPSGMVLSADASITATQPAYVAGSGASQPIWTFNITNATAASKTINAITCGGAGPTNTFNTATKPSTGSPTLQVYQRINNLTKATGTGMQSIGAGGYSYACTDATSGTPQSTCTVTGPAGVAACTNLTIAPEAGANITTSTASYTNPTAPGGGAVAAVESFSPYLTSVSGFAGGRTAQGVTKTNLTSTTVGPITTSTSAMDGGTAAAINTIATNASGTPGNVLTLGGGSDPSTATNYWKDVGVFKRVDIVPANNTYNRTSGRTDCVAATCTYTEEMQNFANWYTYYRTRMQMMKSASSVAFSQLDDKYRVGFDDICNCANKACATSVITPVGQFVDTGGETANQRSTWWTKLTAATPTCETPLRGETAKMGRYFAGKLTGSTDPIQYSCQQNFMLLVTDGYWNEEDNTNIQRVDGSDIANTDNNSTTAPRPYYDGQQAATVCPTRVAPGGANRTGASSCRNMSDIAWYYYSTDLRNVAFGNTLNAAGVDVSKDNVLTSSDDKNTAQHMNFYAMGLGIDGFLEYRSDYQTAGVGDYYEIKQGTRNWPAVSNLDPTGVDDLWHATVNGHGKYFSARNLPNVVAGLREALNKIGARVGSAAAAATSNLEPVAGDNFAYVASYATVDWVGDLQSRSIDVSTGNVSPDTGTQCGVSGSGCQWSAQARLDNMTWSARRIYLKPSSGTSGDPVRDFTFGTLSATEKGYFNPGGGSPLSQYAALVVSNPTDITATKLVDYLRGDRSLEQDGDTSHPQIWRKRAHVFGDIVNTQPVYMKKPSGFYVDAGYSNFVATGTAASRNPVVFVSSQDGMLHAINAHTAAVTVSGSTVQPGEEMWSYIPQQALDDMRILGDVNYGGQSGAAAHRYFIDGPIMVSDVNFGASDNDWHTILVAGLGAGGSSYFALDVTDPLTPTFLWEFTDSTRLGLSFSNPITAKLPNGQWAVFFSSGYNNADGHGYLFAIDPKTGVVKTGYPMDNGSGSGAFPSNLGKIAVWATDPAQNNSAEYVYSGDLNGDLWRFDLDHTASGHTGVDVFKLAHLSSGSTAQPISTKPELTRMSSGTRLVLVGTGKYLETTDLTNTDLQSFYAIKDTMGLANLGGANQQTWNPKTDTGIVGGATVNMFLPRKLISTDSSGAAITKVVNGVTRTYRQVCRGASSIVDATTGACANEDSTVMEWDIFGGWYVDLPDSAERMNVDPKLVRGTLVFATNIPAADSCTVGGTAWANALSYDTGLGVIGADKYVSTKIADSLVVGITVVKLSTGEYKAIATKSNYSQETFAVPVAASTSSGTTGSSGSFGGKRGLWREFEAY